MRIPKAVLVVVYVTAAVATGWQVWMLMMWAVWGRVSSPLEYVALLGALALLAGSCVLLAERRAGLAVIGTGLAALWLYYVPATVTTFRPVAGSAVRSEPDAFIPPLFLLVASVLFVCDVCSGRK